MTQWTERFRSHAMWQQLQSLGPALDSALDREGVDPQTKEGLARLKSVLAFVGKRLAGADSHLFPARAIDDLSSTLQSVLNEVQQFIANGNAGHIVNANANADGALVYLAQISVPQTTDDFIAAKEAADAYRKTLDQGLREIGAAATQARTELDALRSKVAETAADIASERTRLTAISTEYQSQFSTAQESRNKDFADAQSERQERATAVLSDYSKKLSEQDAQYAKQAQDVAAQHQNELTELTRDFVEGTTAIRNDVLARKAEVEKLVGVIGNLAVTSGYLTTATEAKITARIWQGVTVLAMLGLIGVAIYAFLPLVQGTFSWSGFAGRVYVSLTIGVLAAYAASQADRYQKSERRNRQLALELEAIGPFIAPLPVDKQEGFRLAVGERTFGQGGDLGVVPAT